MTVSEFKKIFFWEYTHRMFGRAIGLAYALPFAYFAIRGRLPRKMLWQLTGVGGLFAFQVRARCPMSSRRCRSALCV